MRQNSVLSSPTYPQEVHHTDAGHMSQQLFVWKQRFLHQARSHIRNRTISLGRRLSISVMFSHHGPFQLSGLGAAPFNCEGIIFASGSPRFAFGAVDSGLTIIDAGINTSAYFRLLDKVPKDHYRLLSAGELERLRSNIRLIDSPLDCASANNAFDQVIDTLNNTPTEQTTISPRVENILKLAEQLSSEELSVKALARMGAISESRLRALFQSDFNCSPASFIRWVKLWRAIQCWRAPMTFTDAAQQAGFYDLAHLNRTVMDIFGQSPTALSLAEGTHLQICER